MSCDNGLPIKITNNPLNAPIIKKNQKRVFLADNNYKLKFDFKFAYIDNQPPRKRQKLSHPLNKLNKNKNKHKKQCNTKPIIHCKSSSSAQKPSKLRRKTPILHHSVINERWNMLIINPKKPPKPKPFNLPILAILNEHKSPTNRTPKTIDFGDNSDDLISDNGSMNSFEAAYDHYDDNDIPAISINDIHPQNVQKIENEDNLHNLHRDRSLFPPPIYYQSVNNNKYNNNNQNNMVSNPWSHDLNTMNVTKNNHHEFKWNINRRSEQQIQSEVNGVIKGKMKRNDGNINHNDNDNDNGQSKDYLFGVLRFIFYVLIIWIMAINYGVMRVFNGNYILCDIMGLHTMCKDINANLDEIDFHGLRNGDNEQNLSNSDGLITVLETEWVKYLSILVFIVFTLKLIISFITDTEESRGFDFNATDGINGENIEYFKEYNHINYYNNSYILR